VIGRPALTIHRVACRIVCCWLFLAMSAFASALLEPGEVAPDFQLLSQTGSRVSLKSYKGEWVILFFFGDHSGENVSLTARNLQRDLAKFNAANAAIVGIGRTTPESNQAWAKKEEITFPLLSDPDENITKSYGAGSSGDSGIYEVIVAPNGKVTLPRIASMDLDEESNHLLACLQYFSQHPGRTNAP
jgi:thioredoxin-dependent peroxiredoxin